MSLYDKKLDKLEELAGVQECRHARLLVLQAPPWFTPDGQGPSMLFRQCLDCRKVLPREERMPSVHDRSSGTPPPPGTSLDPL